MDKPVILVVEDNEIQRKVIKLLANEYGFDAVLAGSAAEACDAFAVGGDIYKLVLMDIGLPDADGVQCAMQLRKIENSEKKKIPMVAMTGYSSEQDRARFLKKGFDDLLIKPFSSTEFKEMVIRWTAPNFNVFKMHSEDAESNSG
jgi:two-component system, sensor histidine kinase